APMPDRCAESARGEPAKCNKSLENNGAPRILMQRECRKCRVAPAILLPVILLRRRRLAGFLEHADVAQVAVLLGVIEAVAYDELVGDFKPDVADVHRTQPPLGRIQQ